MVTHTTNYPQPKFPLYASPFAVFYHILKYYEKGGKRQILAGNYDEI